MPGLRLVGWDHDVVCYSPEETWPSVTRIDVTFRRGFIDRIACPFDWWYGDGGFGRQIVSRHPVLFVSATDRVCDTSGSIQRDPSAPVSEDEMERRFRRMDRATNFREMNAAIAADTQFRLSWATWRWTATQYGMRCWMPKEVIRLMDGHSEDHFLVDDDVVEWKRYRSMAAAESALSRALIAWARGSHGHGH
jgi:hypothetical protein